MKETGRETGTTGGQQETRVKEREREKGEYARRGWAREREEERERERDGYSQQTTTTKKDGSETKRESGGRHDDGTRKELTKDDTDRILTQTEKKRDAEDKLLLANCTHARRIKRKEEEKKPLEFDIQYFTTAYLVIA